jgi:hypothetical protein
MQERVVALLTMGPHFVKRERVPRRSQKCSFLHWHCPSCARLSAQLRRPWARGQGDYPSVEARQEEAHYLLLAIVVT